jgi:hypothetical protein
VDIFFKFEIDMALNPLYPLVIDSFNVLPNFPMLLLILLADFVVGGVSPMAEVC